MNAPPTEHKYQVQFNEGQRRILVKAMENCSIHVFENSLGSGCGAESTEYLEYVILLQMLRDMPRYDEVDPGHIHGLDL